MSLVSIVIPTKDRYSYLIEILSIMTKFESNLIEFVIGDNSKNNTIFLNFLTKINDKRIKYFHFKQKLSQSENMNLSISKSNYEYITAIGDDDFVLEHIVDLVKTAKFRKIDAVKFIKPVYTWKSKNFSGRLYLPNFKMKFIKKKSPHQLEQMIKKCGTSMDNNPSVYHGLISRKLLNKIYKKFQNYCPGPSPDIASCIAILYSTKYFFIYDGPIVVSGNASRSMAGLGLKGKHYGEIKDQKHLPSFLEKKWSSQIPFYWSGPTIWAQSVFSTLSKVNQSNNLNYSYLYAFLIIYHPRKFFSFLKNLKKLSFKPSIFYYIIFLFITRLNNFLFKEKNDSITIEGISLKDAYNYLNNKNNNK